MYPYQRLLEEGYEVHVAGPSKKKLQFLVHDFVDGYDTYTEKPGYTPGSGWLDQVRGGWYQQHDAAANPLVRPGDRGLRGVGLDPPPPGPPDDRR